MLTALPGTLTCPGQPAHSPQLFSTSKNDLSKLIGHIETIPRSSRVVKLPDFGDSDSGVSTFGHICFSKVLTFQLLCLGLKFNHSAQNERFRLRKTLFCSSLKIISPEHKLPYFTSILNLSIVDHSLVLQTVPVPIVEPEPPFLFGAVA